MITVKSVLNHVWNEKTGAFTAKRHAAVVFSLNSYKLAKMAGVMYEADHAHSIQSTWWLHRSATDSPFVACVFNLPITFDYYLDLSHFLLEYGLLYFRVLSLCLLLVCFVSAEGCHCFDVYYLYVLSDSHWHVMCVHFEKIRWNSITYLLRTEVSSRWSPFLDSWKKDYGDKLFLVERQNDQYFKVPEITSGSSLLYQVFHVRIYV